MEVGDYKNGKLNGQGYIRYSNGNAYSGNLVDGVLNGYGEFHFFATGDVYKGEFKEGSENGQGVLTIAKTGIV